MQAGGIARLLPFLEEAARSVKIGDEPVVIADYGSSQGRNSMAPMRIAIEEFVQRIPQFSVKPGHDIEYHLGMIQPVTLPLVW